MKKFIIFALCFWLLISVCSLSVASASDEEFLQRGKADVARMTALTDKAISELDGWLSHDSVYLDWSHLWFSWFGHKAPTVQDLIDSRYEKWWGIEVNP